MSWSEQRSHHLHQSQPTVSHLFTFVFLVPEEDWVGSGTTLQHCIRRRPLKSTERVSIATLPGAKHNKQNNVTWKRRLEVRNSKPFSLFVFLFASACERLFIKMHRIESRCDTEPGNRLFAGTSVHFQPGNLTGWDSEGVNHDHLLNDEMISRHGVQTGLFGWPKST